MEEPIKSSTVERSMTSEIKERIIASDSIETSRCLSNKGTELMLKMDDLVSSGGEIKKNENLREENGKNKNKMESINTSDSDNDMCNEKMNNILDDIETMCDEFLMQRGECMADMKVLDSWDEQLDENEVDRSDNKSIGDGDKYYHDDEDKYSRRKSYEMYREDSVHRKINNSIRDERKNYYNRKKHDSVSRFSLSRNQSSPSRHSPFYRSSPISRHNSTRRSSPFSRHSPSPKRNHFLKQSVLSKHTPPSRYSPLLRRRSYSKRNSVSRVSPIIRQSPYSRNGTRIRRSPILRRNPIARRYSLSKKTTSINASRRSPFAKHSPVLKHPNSGCSSLMKRNPRHHEPYCSLNMKPSERSHISRKEESLRTRKRNHSIDREFEEDLYTKKVTEEVRRDPMKTKRDIQRDKDRCIKDREAKVMEKNVKVSETGLCPPGMEDMVGKELDTTTFVIRKESVDKKDLREKIKELRKKDKSRERLINQEEFSFGSITDDSYIKRSHKQHETLQSFSPVLDINSIRTLNFVLSSVNAQSEYERWLLNRSLCPKHLVNSKSISPDNNFISNLNKQSHFTQERNSTFEGRSRIEDLCHRDNQKEQCECYNRSSNYTDLNISALNVANNFTAANVGNHTSVNINSKFYNQQHTSDPKVYPINSTTPTLLSTPYSSATKSKNAGPQISLLSDTNAITPSKTSYRCSLCSAAHYIVMCPMFGDMTPQDRLAFVQQDRLCFRCLGRHNDIDCQEKNRCRKCRAKHHTMIHILDSCTSTSTIAAKQSPWAVVSSQPTSTATHSAPLIKPKLKHSSARVHVVTTSPTEKPASSPCSLCSDSHFIVMCPKFKDMTPQNRLAFVQQDRLCVNCLGRHNHIDCRNQKRCRDCGARHHTMIHVPDPCTSISTAAAKPSPWAVVSSQPISAATYSAAPTKPKSKRSQAKAHIVTTLSTEKLMCSYCSGFHYIVRCPWFRKMTPQDRLTFVQQDHLCFNCLGKHKSVNCKIQKRCRDCSSKHHTMIHVLQPCTSSATATKSVLAISPWASAGQS